MLVLYSYVMKIFLGILFAAYILWKVDFICLSFMDYVVSGTSRHKLPWFDRCNTVIHPFMLT